MTFGSSRSSAELRVTSRGSTKQHISTPDCNYWSISLSMKLIKNFYLTNNNHHLCSANIKLETLFVFLRNFYLVVITNLNLNLSDTSLIGFDSGATMSYVDLTKSLPFTVNRSKKLKYYFIFCIKLFENTQKWPNSCPDK